MSFYNVPAANQKQDIIPGQKATVAFAYRGLNLLDQADKVVASSKYFQKPVSNDKADYLILADIGVKQIPMAGFLPTVLAACTLYLIPVMDGGEEYTFQFTLVDNSNGTKTDLGKIEATRKSYGGLGVLFFGSLVRSAVYMEDKIDPVNQERFAPVFEEALNRAAAQIYDKKSKLHTSQEYVDGGARSAAIAKSAEVSPDDLLFVASNAKSYEEFLQAKTKVKGAINFCALDIMLIANPNQIITKDQTMYWQIIDYYKTSCASFRRNVTSKVGLDKEQLVESVGNPTSVFKINDDTETLSYQKNVLNNGQIVPAEIIVTLDRGIVTKVTQRL